ncbi:MAG: hypothetical protein C4293_01255, partial [Nitrospiraceae bacterium]
VAGTLFFVATGANLSLVHELTSRFAFTANLGFEQDRFTGSSLGAAGTRTDTLKNIAVGLTYRTVKWFGASIQYVYEDRSSDDKLFAYQANTFMVSVQAMF